MVMKTKDNRNRPHHSEHLSIWFPQSVQHRTKCIMNTKRTLFPAKNWQYFAIFGRKPIVILCWRPCNPR